MGDDFDLFPKRENLDPFSFGKKEKQTGKDRESPGEDLFGKEEDQSAGLPDLSTDLPQSTPEASPAAPDPYPDTQEGAGPPTSDQPSDSAMGDFATLAAEGPLTGGSGEPERPKDFLDGISPEGPITESKTFDEPVFEQKQVTDGNKKDRQRKSPSPFLIVSGALVIVIGILYGALTYLKSGKPAVPSVSTPPVSVTVPRPKPAPVPTTKPQPAQPEAQPEAGPAAGPGTGVQAEPTPQAAAGGKAESAARSEAGGGAKPAVKAPVADEAQPKAEAKAVTDKTPAVEQTATAGPVPEAAVKGDQYSVQLGALILDSSVSELEGKLRGLGYEPYKKVGSTTAMMNMLTVGPFGSSGDAGAALKRLRSAGVESNLRRRDNGNVVIDAGSYLLEVNAKNIMKKIRSLGYPVTLAKQEARLPMTFVRVGPYAGMKEATSAKEELKGKGLEGIIVKVH